ncbi:hypothetical protein [Streptomyces chartreusis]|uniref:hypothetical protein n=1 Tax=Streptomyces chartreusis TaxID=1969 RepID=UPI00366A4A42
MWIALGVPGMVRAVVVNGIGHQTGGQETLRERWLPPLNDGLRHSRSGVHQVSATADLGWTRADAFVMRCGMVAELPYRDVEFA